MSFPAINPGELRHSIEVQDKTETRGTGGDFIETWAVKTRTKAKIETLTGRELVEAQQVDARATKKVTLRYTDSVSPSDRIVRGCDIYHPIWINNIEERNVVLEAICRQDTD